MDRRKKLSFGSFFLLSILYGQKEKNLAMPVFSFCQISSAEPLTEINSQKLEISQLKYQKILNFTLRKHRLEIILNANIASVITTT